MGSDNKSGDLGERASEYYHRMTRPAAWLPPYSQVRILDLLYQCILWVKKGWLCGVLQDLIYEQDRKVVIFLGRPQTSLDVELLLATLGITFCTLNSLTHQTQKKFTFNLTNPRVSAQHPNGLFASGAPDIAVHEKP